MPLLYANGCSMTYGAELAGVDPFPETEEQDNYRIEYSWPNQLGKLLNMESVNDGWPGASNDKIFRTSINWISNYISQTKDPSNLFVVIGWSTPERKEIRTDDGLWFDILPLVEPFKGTPKYLKKLTKLYKIHFFNETADTVRTMLHILSMQSFLQIYEIPYLFFNALHLYFPGNWEDTIQPYTNLLDFKHIYYRNGGMYMYCFKHKYKQGPNKHPLEEGHKAWAKKLYDYIIKEGLLND